MGRWNNLFCSGGGGGSIAYILDSAIVKGLFLLSPPHCRRSLKERRPKGLLKIKLLGKCDWGGGEAEDRGQRSNGFLSQREAAAVDKTSPLLFGVRPMFFTTRRGGREREREDHTHLKEGLTARVGDSPPLTFV